MEKRMRKVCAKCGHEERQAEFVGAFCPQCAPAVASSSLPGRIAAERCPRCGRIRRGNGYVDATPGELAALASSKLRGSAEVLGCAVKILAGNAEARLVPAELECTLASDGKEFPKKFAFGFVFEAKLCETCRKIASGYHEAILQLRGDAKKVGNAAERFRAELGADMVTKEKEGDGGVDLFIAERDAMMKLVMSLHRPYTATRKLKGIKRGRHQFITTVCVRF